MTRDNYMRQSGPSWLRCYFSRFLTSRVLRLHVFGRTYRFAWTWHFEAERVRAIAPLSDNELFQAIRAVDKAEAT